MVALSMYLKQPNFIYLCAYIWLATLTGSTYCWTSGFSIPGFMNSHTKSKKTQEPMEVAALGRPLSLGMLYDCRKDSFIPGVTLWDKKSLSENLHNRPQPRTDLKFSSSDSLSSKSSLLDISASLKASFMGGLVEVGGSGKFLRDTKSSNQQSRVTMFYSETTRFEQLTMSQLGQITYLQVFDQKTATHVVTAVLYGAQAAMVFDRTFSEEESKQEIEGKLNVMVKSIPSISIEGEGSVKMKDEEKKMAETISCTFHGDVLLEQNPTTYMEAIQTYKTLPTLLKENPQNVVPIKVWLHPLHLLDNKAAQLQREITTSLISDTEHIIEELGEAERTCNDLIGNTLAKALSDIKERLQLFQKSFSTYKIMLLEAVGRVLPAVRGGEEEEKSLEDILIMHRSSPFSADKLNKWLNDAKSELRILSSNIKTLQGIKIKDSVDLMTILFDPDVDAVLSLTFTSLKYEDPYLSTLTEFLKSDKFKELDEKKTFSVKSVSKWFNEHSETDTGFSVTSFTKWFNDLNIAIKMRQNLFQFRRFAEANKDDKRIRFIISAISNPSIAGSSIYLYEKGKLTDRQFQPVSKPSPPIVKNVLAQAVSLKLQKRSGEREQYRVEYKQVKPHTGAEEPWLFIETGDEDVTLNGLESGKQYLIRYRKAGKVGVSEASDTVNTVPLAEPVIVGGTGGEEFSFKSSSSNSFQKIVITYIEREDNNMELHSLNTIQVIFQDYQMIKVGRVAGNKEKVFLFDITDKIVTATLWPKRDGTRFGGLEFVVEKNNGRRITMSIKCAEVGESVIVNVGSGKCYGIKGRSGDEIDALGFYCS
ncbi:stonustoxin subunit alpha-like isoform X2 [Ctenopharyngodon idella]|uniref:stonustoxin subunit alpha-like isoform X2 n=1 Tax=Ctenopharyngodon idella TaxID=7959 RepID=UPI0022314FDB|nr:stonustoxin subunit alpha-like isoform X2 [Ctenopharyngodon idella]